MEAPPSLQTPQGGGPGMRESNPKVTPLQLKTGSDRTSRSEDDFLAQPKSARGGSDVKKKPELQRSLSQTESKGSFFKKSPRTNEKPPEKETKQPKKTWGRKQKLPEGPLQRDVQQQALVMKSINSKTLPKKKGAGPKSYSGMAIEIAPSYPTLSVAQISKVLEEGAAAESDDNYARCKVKLSKMHSEVLKTPIMTESFLNREEILSERKKSLVPPPGGDDSLSSLDGIVEKSMMATLRGESSREFTQASSPPSRDTSVMVDEALLQLDSVIRETEMMRESQAMTRDGYDDRDSIVSIDPLTETESVVVGIIDESEIEMEAPPSLSTPDLRKEQEEAEARKRELEERLRQEEEERQRQIEEEERMLREQEEERRQRAQEEERQRQAKLLEAEKRKQLEIEERMRRERQEAQRREEEERKKREEQAREREMAMARKREKEEAEAREKALIEQQKREKEQQLEELMVALERPPTAVKTASPSKVPKIGVPPPQQTPVKAASGSKSARGPVTNSKVQLLDDLLARGIITREEYVIRRKKIEPEYVDPKPSRPSAPLQSSISPRPSSSSSAASFRPPAEVPPPLPDFPGLDAFGLDATELSPRRAAAGPKYGAPPSGLSRGGPSSMPAVKSAKTALPRKGPNSFVPAKTPMELVCSNCNLVVPMSISSVQVAFCPGCGNKLF